MRTERHANADFPGPLRHAVRDHTVNANPGQKHGHSGKNPKHRGIEPRLRQSFSNAALQRDETRNKNIRIILVNDAGNS